MPDAATTVIRPPYPAHDALWPLVMMGVLTADHAPNGWTLPAPARRTRVALIDTSVADGHPNLDPALSRDLAFDLFSTRLGAFPWRASDAPLDNLQLGDSAAAVAGLPHCTALLVALKARLRPGQMPRIGGVRPATRATFSAHGTAAAGLIAARPARARTEEAHLPGDTDGEIALPFMGVDPSAELVPISTNFDPDPEALILAFLYADLIGADVIVLPRILPDPLRTVPEMPAHDIDGTAFADAAAPSPLGQKQWEMWDELAQLIVNVSLRRPVVCAAGNANEEFGIYPANLAADDNGVIAVGAVNARGWPCSYSAASGLTIWGPSSDGERFDRAEVRLDVRRHDYDPVGVPADNANHRFSPFSLIATDVPGRGGYAASPFPGPEPDGDLREYGSYYCRFGGTSGAAALVGGFLSLGRSLGHWDRDDGGIAARDWLLSRSKPLAAERGDARIPVLSGEPVFPDDSTP
ncbi:S8/S53 family peptidase [Pararhodobacter sp. SW119]|uniref:S8/S53 family peptidase n=1 Tax=Pararhodobacter sp. SW119 TaxID=2780075 RepID=UPI001AE06B1E|nr:S8/S53 family peptidase [Pararhodobacter sp. SW119]